MQVWWWCSVLVNFANCITVRLLVTKSAQGCTLKRSFQLSSSSTCQSSRRVAIRWADGAQPYYITLRPRAEVREVHKEGWLHRQCSSLCCCHLDSLSPSSPTMVQAVVAIVYCLFVFLAGFFLFRIKHGFIISDLVDKPIELPSSLFCSPPYPSPCFRSSCGNKFAQFIRLIQRGLDESLTKEDRTWTTTMSKAMCCADLCIVTLFRDLSSTSSQDVDHVAETQELRGRAHGGEGGNF